MPLSVPPRVSVVIPCHNSLRYLPATVDSVLAQTVEDFEVVLVDDGGTDDLAGWVGGCGDDRVRLVRQDNAGPAAARNRGVAEAAADRIAFLDSDDLWEPEFLERMLARLDEPDVGLVYCGWDVIDADGRPNGRATVSTWEGDVWERFVTRNPVACSGVVLPRATFEEVGGFEVNRDRFPIDVEDWELWVRIAASHRVAAVPEVLVHHRRHDANSSSNPESLDAAYRHFLDRVFAGAPPEHAGLRPLATARAELLLGWHSLADRRDPQRALAYRRSARRHCPEVRRSADYWRLGAAAAAMRVTGERGFEAVRAANEGARRVLRRLPVERLRREGAFTP
jgi:glycosyltransferase involved in cell wall biosynthesis